MAKHLIHEVQASLAHLPPHVLHVDLLVFRRQEMEAPTGWRQLTSWALDLLRAVRRLRAHRLDSTSGAWPRAPLAVHCDDPVYHLGRTRLDQVSEAELLEAQRWATAHARDRPPCRDPAREQLATLVEERLLDVILEAAYALRRQRRHPRLPPERNPLVPHLPLARRALRAEVLFEVERFARQLGPVPAEAGSRADRDASGPATTAS
jgi:hypothetical protein